MHRRLYYSFSLYVGTLCLISYCYHSFEHTHIYTHTHTHTLVQLFEVGESECGEPPGDSHCALPDVPHNPCPTLTSPLHLTPPPTQVYIHMYLLVVYGTHYNSTLCKVYYVCKGWFTIWHKVRLALRRDASAYSRIGFWSILALRCVAACLQ